MKNFRCKTIRRRLPEDGITQIIFFGYQSDAELCSKVYEGALLYLKYRLKRLFPTVSRARWKDYKKSYLLGFLNGVDQRFQEQVQSSEEFGLMVKIPAEVLEEQHRRMGSLIIEPLMLKLMLIMRHILLVLNMQKRPGCYQKNY